MSVSFVGSTTDQNGVSGSAVLSGAATGTVAWTSAQFTLQANDLILVCTNFYAGSGGTGITVGTPSGYASQFSQNDTSVSGASAVFTKLASGSETSVSLSYTGGSTWGTVIVYVLRGVTSATPSNTAHAGPAATSSPLTNPSLTVGGGSDATVYGYAVYNPSGTGALSWTGTPANLLNWQSENQSSFDDLAGVGWGTGVSSPGSATWANTSGYDQLNWAMDFPAGPSSVSDSDASGTSAESDPAKFYMYDVRRWQT